MSSCYTKDLKLEIDYKLSVASIYSISILSNEWFSLITPEFWLSKFIRGSGSSLENGVDYEREYVVMEKLGLDTLYKYVVNKGYIKLLVSMLAKWKTQDTLILRAALYGQLEIIKLLITNGADIHIREDQALIYAAGNNKMEVVKFLLANGADIHAQEDYALIMAAYYGHVKVVKLLLNNGANIHAQGNNALRWAAANENRDVVKLLLDNGAAYINIYS